MNADVEAFARTLSQIVSTIRLMIPSEAVGVNIVITEGDKAVLVLGDNEPAELLPAIQALLVDPARAAGNATVDGMDVGLVQ